MARDTGSYTRSNPPVADPVQYIAATATNNTTAAVITYTTASAHNLTVGQPVVANGFSNAWLNYDPSSATGAGTPAVVASVTSSTVFTVNMPAVVATASSSVAGFVTQSALVSSSPYGDAWLPTNAITNVVVAREWGASFPIQNNDDRAANVAITGVSANGNQITLTVGAGHGLIAGQRVSIQGIVPKVYNFEDSIASTGATSIVFNSTLTDAVKSYANGAIVSQQAIGGAKAISSAVGAVAYAGSTATTTATAAAAATSMAVATSGLVVGMGVSATVATVLAGTVITAIGSGTVTVNPALSTLVASAATITFSASTGNQYVTQQAHNLSSGQNIAITGASNANYNIKGVATVVDSKTFSVKAPTFKILSVSGTAGTGVVGDGTNVTYYTDSAHGLAGSDKVTITGMTPAGYNVTNGTVLTSPAPTANSFSVANTTTTTVTGTGQAVKNSGAFSGTASIAGDSGWAGTYAYPSGNLDPSLDNHDRVANSDSGYPAFTPSYTTPNIIGLTTSNAIQKIRAAGQTPGFVQFSTDITATTVATTATTLTVTSGTAHNLSVGDTVYLSGSSNTTLNIGDAVVSALPSTVGFTVLASGCTGTVGATALTFRPKNTIVSAQSPSVGATTATVVGFTRNYGI